MLKPVLYTSPMFKNKQTAKYLGMRGGRIGGKVTASRMTPEERSKRAREAAEKRWSKVRDERAQDTV